MKNVQSLSKEELVLVVGAVQDKTGFHKNKSL